MASERHTGDNLRGRFSLLSFVQKVAVGTVATVLSAAIIALLGIQAFSGSSTPAHTSGNPVRSHGATNPTVPSVATTTPAPPPAAPKYLSELAYKEGEKPELGTIELWEHNYSKSIYWEHTGGWGLGHSRCESPWECRGVIYNLKGKYRYLTALVGGTTETQTNETYPGYWWMVADGITAKGKFMLNRPPVPIRVPVSGFHAVELRISADTNGEEPSLAFAEAHVS
jgi:hypothetical protein